VTTLAAPRAFVVAARPRTLVAGVVPVAVGSAVAFHQGAFSPVRAAAALAGALLIQIGTNLANDHYDYVRGADTADRLGPPRATQQGWLSPGAVLAGALACFALAMVVGAYLVAVTGWPLLVVGLVSILCGYAYTGGPFPLGYLGLGDVFVFVFFGLVAVAGTTWVQTLTRSPAALLAGVPVGALGVALLAVNNLRDRETDARAGKRTLVVRFGERFGRAEYAGSLAVAALVPLALWLTGLTSAWALLALLAAPLAVAPLKLAFGAKGAALNEALAGTAKLQLIYGLLLALGVSR